MNKVILIGNITKDIELQTSVNGTSYCRFSLAVPREHTNENGERVVDFINLTAWRNTAENLSKYTEKGSKIAVVGRVQVDSWTDEDGIKKFNINIVAEDVEFIVGRKKQETKEVKKANPDLTPYTDDGLPF